MFLQVWQRGRAVRSRAATVPCRPPLARVFSSCPSVLPSSCRQGGGGRPSTLRSAAGGVFDHFWARFEFLARAAVPPSRWSRCRGQEGVRVRPLIYFLPSFGLGRLFVVCRRRASVTCPPLSPRSAPQRPSAPRIDGQPFGDFAHLSSRCSSRCCRAVAHSWPPKGNTALRSWPPEERGVGRQHSILLHLLRVAGLISVHHARLFMRATDVDVSLPLSDNRGAGDKAASAASGHLRLSGWPLAASGRRRRRQAPI